MKNTENIDNNEKYKNDPNIIFFRILGSDVKWRILLQFIKNPLSSYSVPELMEQLKNGNGGKKVSQPIIYSRIKELNEAAFLERFKRGNTFFYILARNEGIDLFLQWFKTHKNILESKGDN